MRKVYTTSGKSLAIGKLPKGCELCIKGQKLVMFCTGICKRNCWYCTISRNRWQKDHVWANERLVKTDDDILDEARLCSAKGAGLTGGEPLLRLNRVIHYIKLLKENFSSNFHLHLYTCGTGIKEQALRKLYRSGLDELRIHLNKKLIKPALKFNWDVGMEVPVIPKEDYRLEKLVDYLEKSGVKFLNLNELEFSDRNVEPMLRRRYVLKKGAFTAVKGSEATAKEVLTYTKNTTVNLNVHYCTAALKLNYQLRNRLINRANNIRKPFEKVTRNGFLLKGVIFNGDLEKIRGVLIKKKIPQEMFYINRERKRIETSVDIARKLSKKKRFKCALVEEYPIVQSWDFELTPLNYT